MTGLETRTDRTFKFLASWLQYIDQDSDWSTLKRLFHKCTGPECSFSEMRRQNLIDLGWERLLEDSLPPRDTELDAGDDQMEWVTNLKASFPNMTLGLLKQPLSKVR